MPTAPLTWGGIESRCVSVSSSGGLWLLLVVLLRPFSAGERRQSLLADVNDPLSDGGEGLRARWSAGELDMGGGRREEEGRCTCRRMATKQADRGNDLPFEKVCHLEIQKKGRCASIANVIA